MNDGTYHDDSTPAVCDTCLGNNPYIEMMRQKNGAECKICTKPFTVFKWNSEKGNSFKGRGNFKKTVICLTCARSKNCCQACLLDLTFGIDLQTRDHLLKIAKLDKDNNGLSIPNDIVTNAKNVTSRLYNSNLLEEKFKNTEIEHSLEDSGAKEKLEKNLQNLINKESKIQGRKTTMKSTTAPISNQELVSLLKNFPFNGNLQFYPKNNKIKSFFFFGNSHLAIYQIKDYFISLSSEFDKNIISSLYTETNAKFGFVEFSSRKIAEKISNLIYKNQLVISNCEKYKSPCLIAIDNIPIRICWSTKINMASTQYNNEELQKISSVVDKQLINLAKKDALASTKSVLNSKNAKISKP